MNPPPQHPGPFPQPGSHGYYVQAPPPPRDRGVSAGRVVLIILGVLGAMTVGTCAVCTLVVGGAASAVDDAQKERRIKEQQEANEAKRCNDEPTVAWSTIKSELDANEAKVVARWKGACVKIEGTIRDIGAGLGDETYVVVGDDEAFDLRQLHCKPTAPRRALELAKGRPITVWGIGGGEVMGSLMLEHCDW